jgi:DNA-binding MarR family transcriptional regulator
MTGERVTDCAIFATTRNYPADGRAKVLLRTGRGDDIVRRVRAALDAIEREWAERVGEADYAAFRSVLARLQR